MSTGQIVDIEQNTVDSHQTSPAWIVTVLRWKDRTSSNVFPTFADKIATRRPLVIESDALSVSVQNGKGSLTPGCQVILKGGDLNYSTAIAPGDYVFINMLDDEFKALEIGTKARRLQQINGVHDGFKGMFRVKGCRRRLQIDGNGRKQLSYVLTGFAFTELNNVIYFNPYLFNAGEREATAFITNMGAQWNKIIGKKTVASNQDVMKLLVQIFIGNGFGEKARSLKDTLLRNFNSHYLIPEGVKLLLGVPKAEKVADVTNVILGVHEYSNKRTDNLSKIFNPGIVDKSLTNGRFYETANKIQGRTWVKPEYWAQVQAWSILQQYLNAPLNEAYTSFRIAPDSNKIMPTITIRQLPFTKEKLKTPLAVTRFLSMPRWRVSPELITGFDLGRDDGARVNFVQMFGRSTLLHDQFNTSNQIAQGNYVFDEEDVKRNGLRPYITSSNSDFPSGSDAGDIKGTLTPQWKDLVADAVFDGHLKDSGSLQSVGIVEAIDVGMNLQLGAIVYHIEGYSHAAGINADGTKYFRTNFSLSHGMDDRSNSSRPVYPEMVHTDYLTYQEEDYQFERMLPGVNDSQDSAGRVNGERVNDRLLQAPFNPAVGKRRE